MVKPKVFEVGDRVWDAHDNGPLYGEIIRIREDRFDRPGGNLYDIRWFDKDDPTAYRGKGTRHAYQIRIDEQFHRDKILKKLLE
jgi:hypothetical protein